MSIAEKLVTIAKNQQKVYNAGASDFGLKGKGQGELVHFENVHPIEHKVEVGLRSKNLFKAINEDIPIVSGVKYQLTSAEDTSNTRAQFWLYDANKNELKTLTQSMYGFYYGTAYGYWLSGSDTSKLNFSLTFPSEVAYIRFRNAYVDMQFERADTPTAYSPFVADFSDCKVKACGSNLAPLNEVEIPSKDVIVWEGSLSGYSRISWKYDLQSIENPSAAMFRFTIDGATKYASADLTWLDYPINNQTLTKIEIINFSGAVGRVYDIQLEVGSTVTAFEPYIGAEYTAAADGTVEGVKSISPTMNLSTYKAGAVINSECFLDPQAVITDLTNTVITLGGEI